MAPTCADFVGARKGSYRAIYSGSRQSQCLYIHHPENPAILKVKSRVLPIMRISYFSSVALAISVFSRSYSSLEINAGLITEESSSASNSGPDESTADITIRLEILVEAPINSVVISTPTYRPRNAASTNPASLFVPSSLVLPTAWKAYETPIAIAKPSAQVTGWNSTFLKPTATSPSASAVYSHWSANPYSFRGSSVTTRRVPVSILTSLYLTAVVSFLGSWGD